MKKDTVNIIFGDSIAYGLGDTECFGWLNRLRKKDEKLLKEFFLNLSIPGQTSSEIVERFEFELKRRFNNDDEFKLFFSFGIKDALKLGYDKTYLKIFEHNIIELIKIAKNYTTNIHFLGLLNVNETIRVGYKRENIDTINECLETLCHKYSINFINMFDVINIKDLCDGLHPNELGHEKISQYLYESLYKNS